MNKKILIFSPLPPIKSGIADYSHFIAEYLSKQKELTVEIICNQKEIPDGAPYGIRCYRDVLYQGIDQDSIFIYQIGNNSYHDHLYPFLFTYPGVLVLHDYFLGHGRLHLLHSSHNVNEFENEMVYDQGEGRGKPLTWLIRSGITSDFLPFMAEMNRAIIESSIQTIVHNPDVALTLKHRFPQLRIRYIPMGIWEPQAFQPVSEEKKESLRRLLGIPANAFILGSFGVLSPYKRISSLLWLTKRLRSMGYPVFLLLVGYPSEDMKINAIAQNLGLHNWVKVLQNVSKREYWDWLKTVDICFNLRFPPVGECSLSTLEMMAASRPVIMNRHRFNIYFPDTTCIKIRSTHEMEDLIHWTITLYEHPEFCHSLGENARNYVATHNRVTDMIEGYLEVLKTYTFYRRYWTDPRSQFPEHLQPLKFRIRKYLKRRYGESSPKGIFNRFERLISSLEPAVVSSSSGCPTNSP